MIKTAVIGAGVMGIGVAHAVARAGIPVVLVDQDNETLAYALAEIKKNERFAMLYNKTKDQIQADITENITMETDISAISDCCIIIENITEDIEQKAVLYKQMDAIISEDAIILANTSCVPITLLSSYIKNPGRLIGAHFMNPVTHIEAVEVIRGVHTTDETTEKTLEFLSQIDKEGIVVKDFPGFVTNRISHLMMNEAAFIVQDDVAPAEDVDKIFKKCYGHKMGPLETADLIGLDTVVKSLEVLYQSYQDTKYRCCPLLKQMVQAGFLGRKSGRGFYEY